MPKNDVSHRRPATPPHRRLLPWPRTRWGWFRLTLLATPLAAIVVTGLRAMTMPGTSHFGPLPALDADTRQVRDRLEADVRALAHERGERSLRDVATLREAERHVTEAFSGAGHTVAVQEFTVHGEAVRNLEVEIRGVTTPEEIVIVGGHYDSALGPAANDNASGTAAVLELARWAHGRRFARTLRFVAFVNEEPPFFQVPGQMGSEVYARRCRERAERVTAMLSLETIGYYSDARGSQQYPWPLSWFYPDTGNFIAFVGNLASRALARRCVGAFRANVAFPYEGAAPLGFVPGVGWSDHWAFWRHGYPGVMVTDTAPYRYPHYHSITDTADEIDFERTARVVVGLRHVVAALAGAE